MKIMGRLIMQINISCSLNNDPDEVCRGKRASLSIDTLIRFSIAGSNMTTFPSTLCKWLK